MPLPPCDCATQRRLIFIIGYKCDIEGYTTTSSLKQGGSSRHYSLPHSLISEHRKIDLKTFFSWKRFAQGLNWRDYSSIAKSRGRNSFSILPRRVTIYLRYLPLYNIYMPPPPVAVRSREEIVFSICNFIYGQYFLLLKRWSRERSIFVGKALTVTSSF